MLKVGLIVLSCVCIATVVTETVGLSVLWSRGQLTKRTFREIEVILTSGNLFGVEDEDEENKEQETISLDDIENRRVLRIFSMETRERLAGQLVEDAQNIRLNLVQDQENFKSIRDAFYQEIKAINNKNTSEATERSRGILLASSPKDAVNRLMELTVEEDVILLLGMPEESVAAILKALTIKDNSRTKKIFEALSRGEPTKSVADKRISDPQTPTANPAG